MDNPIDSSSDTDNSDSIVDSSSFSASATSPSTSSVSPMYGAMGYREPQPFHQTNFPGGDHHLQQVHYSSSLVLPEVSINEDSDEHNISQMMHPASGASVSGNSSVFDEPSTGSFLDRQIQSSYADDSVDDFVPRGESYGDYSNDENTEQEQSVASVVFVQESRLSETESQDSKGPAATRRPTESHVAISTFGDIQMPQECEDTALQTEYDPDYETDDESVQVGRIGDDHAAAAYDDDDNGGVHDASATFTDNQLATWRTSQDVQVQQQDMHLTRGQAALEDGGTERAVLQARQGMTGVMMDNHVHVQEPVRGDDCIRDAQQGSQVTQMRTQQTQLRISDIMSDISRFQDVISHALDERNWRLEVHRRISQRFEVVNSLLSQVSQGLRQGRNMHVVQRDANDQRLWHKTHECLTVAAQTSEQASTVLHTLRNTALEMHQWLSNLDQEVQHIADRTVIIGVSDSSELQPLFECLYSRWIISNSAIGRVYRAWKQSVSHSILSKDRIAMEKVVRRMQQVRATGLKLFMNQWSKLLAHKKRKQRYLSKFFLVHLQSRLQGIFGAWRALVVRAIKIKNLRSVFERRSLLFMSTKWHFSAIISRARKHKKDMAVSRKNRLTKAQIFYTWAFERAKLRILAARHRVSNANVVYRQKRRIFQAWAARVDRHAYCTRCINRGVNARAIKVLGAWLSLVADLKRRGIKASQICGRVENRMKHDFFQYWTECAERDLVRKFRVAKVRYHSGVRFKYRIFQRWSRYALGIERGDAFLRIRRFFECWKRKYVIEKAGDQVRQNWMMTSNMLYKRHVFGWWLHTHSQSRDAQMKLSRIAIQCGGRDWRECFALWVRVENQSRLYRFQLKVLKTKHSKSLVITCWITWRRFTVGFAMQQQNKLLVHVMEGRISRINTITKRSHFCSWRDTFRRRVSLRKKEKQLEGWRLARARVRIMKSWMVRVWRRRDMYKIKKYGNRRLRRFWLRLFQTTIRERKARLKYGTFCVECGKPHSLTVSKWIPEHEHKANKDNKPPPLVWAAPSQASSPHSSRPSSARRPLSSHNFKVWHRRWRDGIQDKDADLYESIVSDQHYGGYLGSSTDYVEGSHVRDAYVRDGYVKDGYGKDGYGKDGYIKDGYGKDAYVKDGYVKGSYVKNNNYVQDGYVKDSNIKDGYIQGGYVKDNYVRDGYVKDGYVKDGYTHDAQRVQDQAMEALALANAELNQTATLPRMRPHSAGRMGGDKGGGALTGGGGGMATFGVAFGGGLGEALAAKPPTHPRPPTAMPVKVELMYKDNPLARRRARTIAKTTAAGRDSQPSPPIPATTEDIIECLMSAAGDGLERRERLRHAMRAADGKPWEPN